MLADWLKPTPRGLGIQTKIRSCPAPVIRSQGGCSWGRPWRKWYWCQTMMFQNLSYVELRIKEARNFLDDIRHENCEWTIMLNVRLWWPINVTRYRGLLVKGGGGYYQRPGIITGVIICMQSNLYLIIIFMLSIRFSEEIICRMTKGYVQHLVSR